MESTRQQKINRLLQKELGDIFLKDAKQMQGTLISVSEVRTTPDLGIARAYLSVFPDDKGEELIKNIRANTKVVRFELGNKVGKQLRIVPELEFYLDKSIEYMERIDELLSQVKNKDENKETGKDEE